MDKNENLFPEVSNNLLTSPIKNQFIKKNPRIGIKKELKNIKIEKVDGIITDNDNENKFIYTLQECIELNNNNLISYKSLNPQNKLIYTDSNKEEEKNKINNPINYDFLLNILQIDNTSIENNIDGNNGKFIEKYNEIDIEDNNDIVFDSLFESGNLRMAINIENKYLYEYDLLMRKDYNNEKNYSWFYFSIKCKKEGNYKFNILNFIKKKIPFDNNTNVKVLSYNKNDKWLRNTFNVFYYPNSIPISSQLQTNTNNNNNNNNYNNNNNNNNSNINSNNTINFNQIDNTNILNFNSIINNSEDDEQIPNNNSQSSFYTLTFTYYVSKKNTNIPIYFSYCYPYTYTTLQDYLYSLSINPKYKNKLKFSKLNQSISGNPLDILYITNFNSSYKEYENKQIIIFTSRVHPGETVCSYVIEGVINSLLNDKNSDLLKKYIFKIIPMLNPDGVINGCYRNNLLGKDLNRMWSEPSINISPTIFYSKNLVFINKTLFYCDFHGHSKMPNCALYGCSPKKKKVNGKILLIAQELHKTYHWFEEKVFMKIFEEEAKYYQSSGEQFFISKSKMKTARAIAYNEFQISFSYTLETSTMNVTEKIIINDNNNNENNKNNLNNNNNENNKNSLNNKNNLNDKNIENNNNDDNNNKNNINNNNNLNNNNNNNVIVDAISIDKLYIIGNDFVNALIKWDNKTKFYSVLKKIRNEQEEKKIQKERGREMKEKEKSYSTSPEMTLGLSYRNKKKTKKSLYGVMNELGQLNEIIENDNMKNCNTVNSPKPKNNNNNPINKFKFI